MSTAPPRTRPPIASSAGRVARGLGWGALLVVLAASGAGLAGLAWHAVQSNDRGTPVVHLLSHLPLVARAIIRLPGLDHGQLHLRLQSDALVLADALGRVTVVSLASGELVRTLRIR